MTAKTTSPTAGSSESANPRRAKPLGIKITIKMNLNLNINRYSTGASLQLHSEDESCPLVLVA